MNIKKINTLIFVVLISMFINLKNVKASTPNGIGNDVGTATASKNCNFGLGKELCSWGNTTHKTVKLTVYFIN